MPETIYRYHGYECEPDFEWKPNYVGRPPRQTPLLIGLELEITGAGCDEDNAKAVTTAIGFPCTDSYNLVCSEDGSIGPGFEIISQPSTYEYHTQKYNWKAGLIKAEELGYASHDGGKCGLHFHVNRKYFADAMENPETSIMLLIINNQTWLRKFSRRQDFRYCDFPYENEPKINAYQFRTDEQPQIQNKLLDYTQFWIDHYHAVNFNGNATIEFRFCRGTLRYATFLASMQLIAMICYAVRKFRIEQIASVTFSWFKQYAKTMGYKEFLDYTCLYDDK